MRTYSAPTVVEDYHDSAYNACCTIDCSTIPANDWTAENADPNHRGILSQTIMQTHCLYLFIMRRYFWNLFRNCGSQNTPSICSKIFKKSLQNVFIGGRGPTAKNKRWKTTSLSSRWAVTSTSFSLGFSNKTNQTLYQKWYTRHFRYPKMVQIVPVSLPFHGHLASLRSSRRPKMVIL